MTTITTDKKLTVRQIEALKRIRDRGPSAWCDGSRAGGATRRMFERLEEQGLVTVWPPKITPGGRLILKIWYPQRSKP